MSSKERSRLKDKPLRLQGQSLEEERRKLFEDKLETPALMALAFVAMAWIEWWRYVTDQPPRPLIFASVAFLAVAFFVWRAWRPWPRFRALKQGMEGERAVGQYLERLHERGYPVFHDVIGNGFNVDHVLIGPASRASSSRASAPEPRWPRAVPFRSSPRVHPPRANSPRTRRCS
jgi:hypothetical protein